METIKRIYESGIFALPIMFVAGGIVWVALCFAAAAVFS